MSRCPRAVAALVVGAILVVGCSSSPSLTAEDRAEAQLLVVQRSSDAMIELNDADRDCVVDALTVGELAGLREDDLGPVADAVVTCVGIDLIGASVLGQQSGEMSAESLDCAVDELGRPFVVDLVEAAMSDRLQAVQADIAVARALAVCLELDELL